jgi:hypothetical protein
MAVCRLSDDLRILALAGERYRHPDATEQELEEMLDEFRIRWEQINHWLQVRLPPHFSR